MQGHAISGLYRTDHQKFPTYRGDGTGRDSYIIFEDGGFQASSFARKDVRDPQLDHFSNSTRVGLAPGQRANLGSLFKSPSKQYYPPDGTGRDTYIIKGHGGTCSEYKKPNVDFRFNDFLRQPQGSATTPGTPMMDKKIQALSPRRFDTDYSNWPTRACIVKNIENFRTTKQCVQRLSPRISEMSTTTGTGSFFNRRKGSYYKENAGAVFLQPDPIAVAVNMNRIRDRARSTLRTTPRNAKMEQMYFKTPQQISSKVQEFLDSGISRKMNKTSMKGFMSPARENSSTNKIFEKTF